MKIKLQNRKYNGILISLSKEWKAIYFHFPNITYRFFWSKEKGFGKDSYNTEGFEETLELYKKQAPLAQLAEHLTCNEDVVISVFTRSS